MYDSITVTRTLATVPIPDAVALADSLASGELRDDSMLRGPARDIARIVHDHQHSAQHARLPRWEGRHMTSALSSICWHAHKRDEPIVFDCWQFDYGDVVHAHITMCSADTGNRVLPTNLVSLSGMAGTTTRDTRPSRGSDGRVIPGTHECTAYIFGDDDNLVRDLQYLDPNKALAPLVTEHVSGPEMGDPVWELDPLQPGTDVAYDILSQGRATYEAGVSVLTATYRLEK